MKASKIIIERPEDHILDPIYTVSCEKDYRKAAVAATMFRSKIVKAILPIFANMFSDLPRFPRQVVVVRRSSVPEYKVKDQVIDGHAPSKSLDVIGADRFRFFREPVLTPRDKAVKHIKTIEFPLTQETTPKMFRKTSNKIVQTKYRESSAQTIPWQPDNYVIMDGGEPLLLMLDFLSWESGLPCGTHETKLIERVRMKRVWDKTMPPVIDEATLKQKMKLIEAIESDEWLFREQEIQNIQDLRMKLLIQMVNEVQELTKARSDTKIESICKTKYAEKEAKLKRLHHETQREMRKLDVRHRGIGRYAPVNVIKEHVDKRSELYAPLMRHGVNPKHWHQVIEDHIEKYHAQYLGVENVKTLPRWLSEATKITESSIKLPGTQLCIRETKWTAPILKKLHEELKYLHKVEKKTCSSLMVRVSREPEKIPTPHVDETNETEESLYQATVLIQSVLRGRASQVLIYEGRDRCKELIQELRSTHALQERHKERIFYERLDVKLQQREYALCIKNTATLREALNKLSSNVVGTLLDFLTKELRRLMEERRVHAMCLAFERERKLREAAEAGRRQLELRRRLEHDEMFKQIVKVNQDTVDLYLADIITEGMEMASKAEATHFVKNLAKKIDEDTYTKERNSTYSDNEELVANLVHNFLLPEVEKQIVREKIKKKQQNYLKIAMDVIYDTCPMLPKTGPKLSHMEKSKIRSKKLKRAVHTDTTVTYISLPVTKTPHTISSIESNINIIFSATEVGYTNFQAVSNIYPTMVSLDDKQDAPSSFSGSNIIPIKIAEPNLVIPTLETPFGVSNEILAINLDSKNNLQ
ncbi:hypothetical protein FQA39_LY07924 [Lamprigera yunnana]|nr:hypothetical protein FQA39_LY07924 [Lamprigera yunnana]